MISLKIQKTNNKSCVLDSFACCLGIEPKYLIDEVGHDGSKDGFITQELITPLQKFGYGVTPIELFPRGFNIYDQTTDVRFFPPNFDTASNIKRFVNFMHNARGVLAGHNKKKATPHAVCWRYNQIFDPATQLAHCLLQYNEDGEPCGFLEDANFAPHTFWRVQYVFSPFDA